jgi:serine/threonine protein kinase
MEGSNDHQVRSSPLAHQQGPEGSRSLVPPVLVKNQSLEHSDHDEPTTNPIIGIDKPTHNHVNIDPAQQDLTPKASQGLAADEVLISGSSKEQLLIEEGGNYILDGITQLPFAHIKMLGTGLSAFVEMVKDTKTGNVFAKKTIKFPQAKLRAQKEEHFTNEVSIIRSLKNHHHVVHVFATYVAKREFGMILQPAATEGSLEDYLGAFWDPIEDAERSVTAVEAKKSILEKAFGCLAGGLAYIHAKGIRHKDIKPQNILVHLGSVLYTDFGSSTDVNQSGERTTEGQPTFFTRRYSAPEVLAHTKRNYGADIYSLGCVYVELLSALVPSIEYDEEKQFSDIMEHVHHELRSASIPQRLAFISKVITSMTRSDREERPAADQIFSDFSGYIGFCCPECNRRPKPQRVYTDWVWSTEQSRHYCYIMDEDGQAIGYVWSGFTDRLSAPAVVIHPSSETRYVCSLLYAGYLSCDASHKICVAESPLSCWCTCSLNQSISIPAMPVSAANESRPAYESRLLSPVQSSSKGDLDTTDSDVLDMSKVYEKFTEWVADVNTEYRRAHSGFFVSGRVSRRSCV